MDIEQLRERLEANLRPFGFDEVHNNLSADIQIVVKTPFTLLNGLFGGRGLVVVAQVPETIQDAAMLAGFARRVRRSVNEKFLSFPYYKSMHTFLVLLCPHSLFSSAAGAESRLKDRTGLHLNLVQGVVVVDSETSTFRSDYTRPAQHKREFDAVIRAIEESQTRAIHQDREKPVVE